MLFFFFLIEEVFVPSKMLTEMRVHDPRKDAPIESSDEPEQVASFQNSKGGETALLEQKGRRFDKLVREFFFGFIFF